MNKQQETAILFFTRTLKEEFLSKPLGLKNSRFDNLYRLLVHKTISTIEHSGITSRMLSSSNQIGDSFGERLVNGISNLFSEGFKNVIVIGNDAPELTASDLIETKFKLEEGKNILGRDQRGGVYVIGIRKEDFSEIDLKSVDWNTNKVYEQLSSLLNAEQLTPVIRDVNLKSDLLYILKSQSGLALSKLRLILQFIFNGSCNYLDYIVTCFQVLLHRQLVLRGPPL